jgi:hypothetical protein
MTCRRRYDPTNGAQVFAMVRRDSLAARLKVTSTSS